MKTHELRIGNYIQVPFGNETWVRSVDSINYDSIMTENGRFCFEDQYDFVPLTEEWLVNFGFPIIEYPMSFLIEENSLFSDEMEFSSCNRINWSPIKYVHQLQNLYFALTGEELKLQSNELRTDNL